MSGRRRPGPAPEGIVALRRSPAVIGLLRACGLPTDDLRAGLAVRWWGLRSGGHLVGVVGLETHGREALLRSLAVRPEAQGTGTGTTLVAHAEAQARRLGLTRLHLLTTTAEAFFARLGYARTERAAAPEAIARTAQFAGLCPSSAAFMSKELRP